MNKILRRILLGLIIWAVPFLTSFFIWDPAINAPGIDTDWFHTIMAFTLIIGFCIAAIIQFKPMRPNYIREGWLSGITWYLVLIVLDFALLVNVFGMSMSEYYRLLFAYLILPILSVSVGYSISPE